MSDHKEKFLKAIITAQKKRNSNVPKNWKSQS